MRKFIVTLTAATSLLALAGTAEAGHRHNHVGEALAAGVVGGIIGGIIAGPRRDTVYVEREPVYVERRVYVEPEPVYVEREPIYVEREPVYVDRPARRSLDRARRHDEPRVVTYDGGRDGGSYEPWSPEWRRYCADRYRSFDSRSGTFLAHSGERKFCVAR